MNVLLVITGIIFLIGMIVGYARGFIRIVASLLATALVLVVVMFVSPIVSDMILEITPLETVTQEKCMELLAEVSPEEVTELAMTTEFSREVQIEMIEGAKVPSIFKELLLENNNAEIYESLGVNHFLEYVGSYVAGIIANIIAFLLVFLVMTILVRMILYILGIISDLPLIGGANRFAGACLGMGTSLLVVWIIFVVITLCYNTAIGVRCMEEISQSAILTYLYDKNLLLAWIVK